MVAKARGVGGEAQLEAAEVGSQELEVVVSAAQAVLEVLAEIGVATGDRGEVGGQRRRVALRPFPYVWDGHRETSSTVGEQAPTWVEGRRRGLDCGRGWGRVRPR